MGTAECCPLKYGRSYTIIIMCLSSYWSYKMLEIVTGCFFFCNFFIFGWFFTRARSRKLRESFEKRIEFRVHFYREKIGRNKTPVDNFFLSPSFGISKSVRRLIFIKKKKKINNRGAPETFVLRTEIDANFIRNVIIKRFFYGYI